MPIKPRLKNLRQIVTPWEASVRTCWTIGQLKAALAAQRFGDLGPSSQLWESMLEDDEIPGSVDKRVNATLKSPLSLKPREDRDLTAQEQEAEDLFPDMAPDDELCDFMTTALMQGAAVAKLEWDTTGPLWIPRLVTLPSEYLVWQEDTRVWQYHAREGIQTVTPGDGKWVLMTRGQRGWAKGLVRPLALTWIGKQLALGDWQRYCQKHGLPIIKAKVPMVAHVDDKDDFLDDLDELQSEGVIGLPQGSADQASYDVELLEAKDTSHEAFKNYLERADRKIQCLLLGSNIGTEQSDATGGSRAASETSSKDLDRDKAAADSKWLGQTLQRQLLTPFFAFNYGVDVAAPFPNYDTCPEDDAREWQAARTAFVDMLGKLPSAGYKLKNIDEIAAEFGMQLEETDLGPVADRPSEPAPGGPGAPAKKPAKKAARK